MRGDRVDKMDSAATGSGRGTVDRSTGAVGSPSSTSIRTPSHQYVTIKRCGHWVCSSARATWPCRRYTPRNPTSRTTMTSSSPCGRATNGPPRIRRRSRKLGIGSGPDPRARTTGTTPGWPLRGSWPHNDTIWARTGCLPRRRRWWPPMTGHRWPGTYSHRHPGTVPGVRDPPVDLPPQGSRPARLGDPARSGDHARDGLLTP